MKKQMFVRIPLSFFSDGSINSVATHEALTVELKNLHAKQVEKQTTVAEDTAKQDAIVHATVDSVFAEAIAKNPTVRLTRDQLVYSTMQKLGYDPMNVRKLDASLDRWLSSRCDKAGCDTGKPFVAAKGRSGGISRRSESTIV